MGLSALLFFLNSRFPFAFPPILGRESDAGTACKQREALPIQTYTATPWTPVYLLTRATQGEAKETPLVTRASWKMPTLVSHRAAAGSLMLLRNFPLLRSRWIVLFFLVRKTSLGSRGSLQLCLWTKTNWNYNLIGWNCGDKVVRFL